MDKLIIIAGYIGRFMVLLGMISGCILLWTLIVKCIL